MKTNLFKNLFWLVLLGGLVMMSPSTAHAVFAVDGDLSDWGITPFTDWTPDNPLVRYTVENDTFREYSDYWVTDNQNHAINERFDLEAFYAIDVVDADDRHMLHFALVTSNSFLRTWAGEDFGIDLDGDGEYEHGATFSKIAPGLQNRNVYQVRYWEGLTVEAPGLPTRFFPYNIIAGTWLGSYEIYAQWAGAPEDTPYGNPVYNYGHNTFIFEGAIDLAMFGGVPCGQEVGLYIPSIHCLKDYITVEGGMTGNCPDTDPGGNHAIPEPSTTLLLLSGLLGFGALKMWRNKK